jgi:hypothetical protein
MAITLRQESATGATTKGDSLTFSELDNNFIDILQNKIQAIQIDADSGSVNVGEALSNGVLTLSGGTNITTSVTEDSAGNANVVINGTDLNTTYTIGAAVDGANANINLAGSDASTDTVQLVAGTGITLNVDSAGAIEIVNTVADTDTDTTYTINAQADGSNVNFNLAGSDASTDTIQFVAGTGITLNTDSAGAIEITNSVSGGIANVVEDTTPQLGGNLDCQGNEIQNPVLEDYAETVYALGSTDSPTITVSNGNVQTVTISSGLSLPAFSDAATGQTVTLIVTGSGTASGTGAYKFAGGNTTLTSYSVVSIFYDGTTYWASVSTDYQ